MIAKNNEEFTRLVLEREHFYCQGCSKDYSHSWCFDKKLKNKYLCAHHIKRKKPHPELRLETDNGICTCLDCHTKHHDGNLTYRPNNETEDNQIR